MPNPKPSLVSISMVRNQKKIRFLIPKPENQKSFSERLLFFGTISAGLSYFLLWINTFYFNSPVSSIVSFRPVDSWCPSENSGVGVHCFSDYYSPVAALHVENPWDEMGYAYTPLASRLFLPFDQLADLFNEPRVGLFAYLVLGVGCMLLPLMWAGKTTKGFNPIFAVVFGLLGTPLISAFDRGSVVMFTTPWLFIYSVTLCRRNWGLTTLSIIVLTSIKPQYIVLLLPFFIYRKWHYLLHSLRMILLTTSIGFLAFTPNPLRVAKQWFNFASGHNEIGDGLEANLYNVSLIEFIKKIVDDSIIPLIRLKWDIPNAPVFIIGLIFVLCFIVPLIFCGGKVSLHGATIVSISAASLIIPQSNFYYQNFCIIVIAIILRDPSQNLGSGSGVLDSINPDKYMSQISKYLLMAATIISCFNVPISIDSFSTLRDSNGIHASISRIIVAPMWLFVISSINIDSIRNYRRKPTGQIL